MAMYNRTPNLFDPFVRDSLLQRFPVPGATRADKAAAAQELSRRGMPLGTIMAWLRLTERYALRLLDTTVYPMPALDEDEDIPDEWPRCGRGHELEPTNRTSRGRCRTCQNEDARNNYRRKRIPIIERCKEAAS